MALSISENRDARVELELVRRLLNSTLLSLASPVDPRWDPYDVKPQVFALNNYIALPVFTSLAYLQLFCRRFEYEVRDPSGVQWASKYGNECKGRESSDGAACGILPPGIVSSEWWRRRYPADADGGGASLLSLERPTSSNGDFGGQVEREDDALAMQGQQKEVEPCRDGDLAGSPPALAAEEISADDLFDVLDMTSASLPPPLPTSPVAKIKRKRSGAAGRRTSALHRRHRQPRKSQRGKRSASQEASFQNVRRRRASRGESLERASASHSGDGGPSTGQSVDGERVERPSTSAQAAAYWEALSRTAPFDLKQATPLPTFGAFRHPFLIGYFADISTLLHNASIVPAKVDIVVNPASPIECVLSREVTDRILNKDQLLHEAYLKVEKELQREFASFFARHCPEVISAKSACFPVPINTRDIQLAKRKGEQAMTAADALQAFRNSTRLLREAEYSNGVAYEVVLLLQSSAMEETFFKMQSAKQRCMLMGHTDLDILPESAAAPHVRDVAQCFYDRTQYSESSRNETSSSTVISTKYDDVPGEVPHHAVLNKASTFHPVATTMGVFQRRGSAKTINLTQSADSYFHDPTNAYTEPHAIFTEELKVMRGQ